MEKVIFQLEQLTCPSCIKKIEAGLQDTLGVHQAFVFFNSCKVKVEYDPNKIDDQELKSKINQLGFKVH